jgi:hypothetical protein
MLKWFENWRKERKKMIFLEVQEELQAEEESNHPQLQRVVSEEAEKFRDSDEPWVTIIGDTVSDDGIQIALDWNEAFVKYLRSEGVSGADETQVVQKWLAMIAQQASEKLSNHFVDTDGKMSEYT